MKVTAVRFCLLSVRSRVQFQPSSDKMSLKSLNPHFFSKTHQKSTKSQIFLILVMYRTFHPCNVFTNVWRVACPQIKLYWKMFNVFLRNANWLNLHYDIPRYSLLGEHETEELVLLVFSMLCSIKVLFCCCWLLNLLIMEIDFS